MFFVGFPQYAKGYILYDPIEQRQFLTRNAIFDHGQQVQVETSVPDVKKADHEDAKREEHGKPEIGRVKFRFDEPKDEKQDGEDVCPEVEQDIIFDL